jgi:ABC-type nitrate/sulfonate/bicarbonate transport system permease component
MLAGMALLAVVVLLIAAAVRRVEKHLLRWQQPR